MVPDSMIERSWTYQISICIFAMALRPDFVSKWVIGGMFRKVNELMRIHDFKWNKKICTHMNFLVVLCQQREREEGERETNIPAKASSEFTEDLISLRWAIENCSYRPPNIVFFFKRTTLVMIWLLMSATMRRQDSWLYDSWHGNYYYRQAIANDYQLCFHSIVLFHFHFYSPISNNANRQLVFRGTWACCDSLHFHLPRVRLTTFAN